MEDKNCELLFEYLRSILYDPSPEKLDISQLEPQFQKLGKGFRYLDKAVRESFNMAGKAGRKWGLFADSLLSWGIFGCIQYND